jgi:K+-transporting ATPase ATPase C chain
MDTIFRPAFTLLILFTVLTGLAYPLSITGLAGLLMPYQAEGSLVRIGDKIVGSALIGQDFHSDRYFWPRPSATGPTPYDASASAATNLGPTSAKLKSMVAAQIERLHAAGVVGKPPVDAVTSSGSGLDPDISPANARAQIARIAASRNIAAADIEALVAGQTQGRFAGLIGEPRVNVLALNMALDSFKP